MKLQTTLCIKIYEHWLFRCHSKKSENQQLPVVNENISTCTCFLSSMQTGQLISCTGEVIELLALDVDSVLEREKM